MKHILSQVIAKSVKKNWAPKRRIQVFVVTIGLLGLSVVAGPVTATATGISFQGTCPAGTVPLLPVKITTNTDGSVVVTYSEAGAVGEVRIPPNSFSPLAASAAELELYGLPPRPSDTAALSSWTTDMTSWHRNTDAGLCRTNATAPSRTVSSDAPTALNGVQGTIYNYPIWSGYVLDVPTVTYIGVQGDFNQPSKGSSSCTGDSLASWTGIGGNQGSQKLIQAGTAYLRGSNTPVAWYEYLGPNNTGINLTVMSGVTVHSGDVIHTYVVHQTSGTGLTTFYVADNTTGTSQSTTWALGSTYYDGTSADWIDERLSYNQVPTPLSNFNLNSWNNANVQKTSGTWNSLGSQTPIATGMWVSPHYLAYPSGLNTSTTFTDFYLACQ